jgi:hypothetical protein
MAPAGAAAVSKAAAQVAARTMLRIWTPPSRNGCPARPKTSVSIERCDSIRSLTEQVLKPAFSVPGRTEEPDNSVRIADTKHQKACGALGLFLCCYYER